MFMDKMTWIRAHTECLAWRGNLVNYFNFNEFSFVHTWLEISKIRNEEFPTKVWSSLKYDKNQT